VGFASPHEAFGQVTARIVLPHRRTRALADARFVKHHNARKAQNTGGEYAPDGAQKNEKTDNSQSLLQVNALAFG
jgi:ribosomal protein L1